MQSLDDAFGSTRMNFYRKDPNNYTKLKKHWSQVWKINNKESHSSKRQRERAHRAIPTVSRGAECTSTMTKKRRKRKKVTSDRERQVRRIVDGLLRNERTATKPRRALQKKKMIDLLVSTARKDSAHKTQTAITGIFRPAYFKKKQSKAGNTSPFVQLRKKMVDRPVLNKNQKETEVEQSTAIAKQTKAEGNSMQEPKLETVSVLA